MRHALAAALLLSLTLPARADVPPPETEPCMGKEAGRSCKIFGEQGVCTESTCSRATRDGEVEYPCTKCLTTRPDGTPVKSSGCAHAGVLAAGLLGLVALRRRSRRSR